MSGNQLNLLFYEQPRHSDDRVEWADSLRAFMNSRGAAFDAHRIDGHRFSDSHKLVQEFAARRRALGSSCTALFVDADLTMFQRQGSEFICIGASNSIRGRPTTQAPLSDLVAALSDAGPTTLILIATWRSSSKYGLDLAPHELPLLLSTYTRPNVDLCCLSVNDAAAPLRYSRTELHQIVAWSLEWMAAKGTALTTMSFLQHLALVTRHTITCHCVAQQRLSDISLGSPSSLPSFILDDLFLESHGSRLDAVVELASIYQRAGDEGDRSEAADHLHRILTTDPHPMVRAQAQKALAFAERLTWQELRELEICHDDLDRLMLSKSDVAFVTVPKARHIIGVDAPLGQDFERPAFPVELPEFAISTSHITVSQYYRFLRASDWPAPSDWWADSVLAQRADHPVVSVSYYDALAYCSWLSSRTESLGLSRSVVRLPTEIEWEAAARYPDNRYYPWGNSFERSNCNTLSSKTGCVEPVGSHSPIGDGALGIADLVGNVWEWTCSPWGLSGRAPVFRYPLQGNSAGIYEAYGDRMRMVIRGGAYYYTDDCSNSYTRNRAYPRDEHPAGGFRVVAVGQ